MALTDTPADNQASIEYGRIHLLCDALRPEDPLRACDFTALRLPPQDMDGPPARLLLDTLAGPRPGTLRTSYSRRYVVRWMLGGAKIHPEYTPREIAAWALGHVPLSPEHRAEAIPLLASAIRGTRNREAAIYIVNVGRGWVRGWLFFMALYAVSFIVAHIIDGAAALPEILRHVFIAFAGSAMAATLFSPLFVSIALGQTERHRASMRGAAARSLGRLAAPEGLGALAGALADGANETRQGAIAALPCVVAALTPEWYGQMPANTTRDICRALRTIPLPAATHLQLIQALAVIGDGSAAADVEALLAGSRPPRHKGGVVLSHLRALLPLLQARRQQEQDTSLLLRGSQQATSAQDQLLRASTPQNPSHPPEQLLRAAEDCDKI